MQKYVKHTRNQNNTSKSLILFRLIRTYESMIYHTLFSPNSLYCQCSVQKYGLSYFYLVASGFLAIFAQKFIMSYYGA